MGGRRQHLASELGLDPGPALKSLQEQILEQTPSLSALALAGARPGLLLGSDRVRTGAAHPTNLPAGNPKLVGRTGEVQRVVTSQVPLRLAQEPVLPVRSLDETSALLLIEEVARQRATQLSDEGEQRDALKEIVSILDGLPLSAFE